MAKRPPEWWLKQREPRFGCADVTIVAIAAIAAFVILILILSRADFGTILERVPAFNGAATATANPNNNPNSGSNLSSTPLPDDTATALAVAAITPGPPPASATPIPLATATPNAAPTATPLPKAAVKIVCLIRRGDKPSTSDPAVQAKVGWKLDLDGSSNSSEGYHWLGIIVDDPAAGQYNGTKGWIVDNCLGPV